MAKNILILHDEDKINQVLTRIQNHLVKHANNDLVTKLLTDEWDWAVVFAWLVDNRVISTPKQRPPLQQFIIWLNQHPDWNYIPTPKDLSRAYDAWLNAPHSKRSTLLYDTITKLFSGQTC